MNNMIPGDVFGFYGRAGKEWVFRIVSGNHLTDRTEAEGVAGTRKEIIEKMKQEAMDMHANLTIVRA